MSISVEKWTTCVIKPQEYGVGLRAISMQGREAKHQQVKEYYKQTAGVELEKKWKCVFKHEYAELLLNRETTDIIISNYYMCVSMISSVRQYLQSVFYFSIYLFILVLLIYHICFA